MVLRADPPEGDELEPTPGAPCLESLNVMPEEDVVEVSSTLYVREETVFDILVYEREDFKIYLRVCSSLDCVRVLELRVEGCGSNAGSVLGASSWPEVSRVAFEGECVELIIPSTPHVRVKAALEKLGVSEVRAIAFRPVRTFSSSG